MTSRANLWNPNGVGSDAVDVATHAATHSARVRRVALPPYSSCAFLISSVNLAVLFDADDEGTPTDAIAPRANVTVGVGHATTDSDATIRASNRTPTVEPFAATTTRTCAFVPWNANALTPPTVASTGAVCLAAKSVDDDDCVDDDVGFLRSPRTASATCGFIARR